VYPVLQLQEVTPPSAAQAPAKEQLDGPQV
jgi:hypothetical protein